METSICHKKRKRNTKETKMKKQMLFHFNLLMLYTALWRVIYHQALVQKCSSRKQTLHVNLIWYLTNVFIVLKFGRVQWAKMFWCMLQFFSDGGRLFLVSYLSVELEWKGSNITCKNVPRQENLLWALDSEQLFLYFRWNGLGYDSSKVNRYWPGKTISESRWLF